MKRPSRKNYESPSLVPGFVSVDFRAYTKALEQYINYLESKTTKQIKP